MATWWTEDPEVQPCPSDESPYCLLNAPGKGAFGPGQDN